MKTVSPRSCVRTMMMLAVIYAGDVRLADAAKQVTGTIQPNATKTSVKQLETGDVLLVAVHPSSDAGFEVVGPEGRELRRRSFEHVGATKNYAVLITASGKHKLRLINRSSTPVKCSINVDVVKATSTPEEKLRRVLSHWHSPLNPGGALTVVRDGKAIFRGTFGSADVEHQANVDEATVFDTASVAKHVTAMVVSMLVHDGKLKLDDDVRKYLPEVPDFGETITIRNLLHHTSGLRDFPGLMVLGDWHDDDVITLRQVTALVTRQVDLNFVPGSEFTYSNTGYSLLAEIVERVTNQDLAAWTQENLFSPLGMKHTFFLKDIKQVIPNVARGYSLASPHELTRVPNNLAAMGSSSLMTTAHDMGIWMANFDTKAVGSQGVMDLMSLRGKLKNGQKLDYGYGIAHREYRGLARVEHSGSSGGFRSHLVRYPAQRLSAMALCNQGNFDPGSLVDLATDIYLSGKLQPEQTKPETPKTADPQVITVDTATLDKYVGSYEIQPGETLQITREDDHLVIRPKGHPEVPPIVANPLSQTRFTGPPNGSIEFVMNDDGVVTKGVLRQGERAVGEAKRLNDTEEVDLADYAGVFSSPELRAECELAVIDGALIAQTPKRVRSLGHVAKDRFVSDDGVVIEFERSGGKVVAFKATTGSRVRNVRFQKR